MLTRSIGFTRMIYCLQCPKIADASCPLSQVTKGSIRVYDRGMALLKNSVRLPVILISTSTTMNNILNRRWENLKIERR